MFAFFYHSKCYEDIGLFTVTSHAESCDRLLPLVVKTDKLAAIFIVFTL